MHRFFFCYRLVDMETREKIKTVKVYVVNEIISKKEKYEFR